MSRWLSGGIGTAWMRILKIDYKVEEVAASGSDFLKINHNYLRKVAVLNERFN